MGSLESAFGFLKNKKQSHSTQKIVDSEAEVGGGNRSNDGTTARSILIDNKSSHLKSSKL
jgi:hypothetical protein